MPIHRRRVTSHALARVEVAAQLDDLGLRFEQRQLARAGRARLPEVEIAARREFNLCLYIAIRGDEPFFADRRAAAYIEFDREGSRVAVAVIRARRQYERIA